jgi:DNA-binding MarR family transcriptional regulator
VNLCIDDLTANSRLVLLYVRDNRGCTGQEICDYLAISPTELADALAPLQAHGLLVSPS